MGLAAVIKRAARFAGDIWSGSWSTIGGIFGIGGYNATDPRRKILPHGLRPTQATANELLTASLPLLRAYCRQLERNHPVARGAIEGRIAEIVGTGIDGSAPNGRSTSATAASRARIFTRSSAKAASRRTSPARCCGGW